VKNHCERTMPKGYQNQGRSRRIQFPELPTLTLPTLTLPSLTLPTLTLPTLTLPVLAWAVLALAVLAANGAAGAASGAELRTTDDRGREVVLAAPAVRVISLAPHLTEILFGLGAGARVVATVEHADYPSAALNIPRVGNAARLDLERIIALQPDLIVAWASGNPRATTERLEQLGLTVYYSEPSHFAGIATTLERLGLLTGHTETGQTAARTFIENINDLQSQYASRSPVRVFYQVWPQPLMTVNAEHVIGAAITLCGGENIFADSRSLVPRPDLESVLAANPEVIVTGGPGEDDPSWLEPWREWPQLAAVKDDNLFFIPPALLQRHTPRILEGTQQLCHALAQARERRMPH